MPNDKPPKWGAGRVAFVARLSTIRSELEQGLTLLAIYERHRAALGIGYSAFCKLVLRHADDAKPLRRRSPTTAKAPAVQPPPPKPPVPAPNLIAPPPERSDQHARHEPRPRTFNFDGNPKQDDKSRLIGGPSRDPKG
jgi:hypothetical protein